MRRLAASLVVLVLAFGATVPAAPDDPLPSWRAGPARDRVMDFVGRVTAVGGPDYVLPAAAAPSPPSGIPTVTCRCCSGRRPGPGPV